MKRQVSDECAGKIKQLHTQSYKAVQIRDLIKQEYGVSISISNINNIKSLRGYEDIRSGLNDKIRAIHSRRKRFDDQIISDIKWALAEGYSIDEILESFDVRKNLVERIRQGHVQFYSISPEYNHLIEKRLKKKKQVNINKKMIMAIKEEYVTKGGDTLLVQIAEKHEVGVGTVSNILNLRYYKEIGTEHNSTIISIKKRKKRNLKIEKEKQNNELLREQQKQIEVSNTKLKNFKSAA